VSVLYIVIGRLGEYSDAREWCVRAFRNETAAHVFAEAAHAHMTDLARDEDFRERTEWAGDLSAEDAARLTRYDATLAYTSERGRRVAMGWTYASDPPSYTVVPCAFEDA
jgi:hypothetical protein